MVKPSPVMLGLWDKGSTLDYKARLYSQGCSTTACDEGFVGCQVTNEEQNFLCAECSVCSRIQLCLLFTENDQEYTSLASPDPFCTRYSIYKFVFRNFKIVIHFLLQWTVIKPYKLVRRLIQICLSKFSSKWKILKFLMLATTISQKR